MKHTPTPWAAIFIYGSDKYYIEPHESQTQIATDLTEEDAERIVACVNACEGMEDPASEIADLVAENNHLQNISNDIQEKYLLREEIASLKEEMVSLLAHIATLKQYLEDGGEGTQKLKDRIAELENSQATALFEIEKDERFCLEGLTNPVLDDMLFYNYNGKLAAYGKIKNLLNTQTQL